MSDQRDRDENLLKDQIKTENDDTELTTDDKTSQTEATKDAKIARNAVTEIDDKETLENCDSDEDPNPPHDGLLVYPVFPVYVHTFPCPVIVHLLNLTPGSNFIRNSKSIGGPSYIRSSGKSAVVRHDGKELAILKISNSRRRVGKMNGCMSKMIKWTTTLLSTDEHFRATPKPPQESVTEEEKCKELVQYAQNGCNFTNFDQPESQSEKQTPETSKELTKQLEVVKKELDDNEIKEEQLDGNQLDEKIISNKPYNAIQINIKQETVEKHPFDLAHIKSEKEEVSQPTEKHDETSKKQSSSETAEKQTNANEIEASKKQSNEEMSRNNHSDEESSEDEDKWSKYSRIKVLRSGDFFDECFVEPISTDLETEGLSPLKDVPLVFISSEEDSNWTVLMKGVSVIKVKLNLSEDESRNRFEGIRKNEVMILEDKNKNFECLNPLVFVHRECFWVAVRTRDDRMVHLKPGTEITKASSFRIQDIGETYASLQEKIAAKTAFITKWFEAKADPSQTWARTTMRLDNKSNKRKEKSSLFDDPHEKKSTKKKLGKQEKRLFEMLESGEISQEKYDHDMKPSQLRLQRMQQREVKKLVEQGKDPALAKPVKKKKKKGKGKHKQKEERGANVGSLVMCGQQRLQVQKQINQWANQQQGMFSVPPPNLGSAPSHSNIRAPGVSTQYTYPPYQEQSIPTSSRRSLLGPAPNSSSFSSKEEYARFYGYNPTTSNMSTNTSGYPSTDAHHSYGSDKDTNELYGENLPDQRKINDFSPDRRRLAYYSPDRRRLSDYSPDRKRRHDDSSPDGRRHYDNSPERRRHYDDTSLEGRRHYDDSPPEGRRHCDDSPERSRHYDDSPERRRHYDDSSPEGRRPHHYSPERRRRYDSSPERRRHRDYSPERRRQYDDDWDSDYDRNSRKRRHSSPDYERRYLLDERALLREEKDLYEQEMLELERLKQQLGEPSSSRDGAGVGVTRRSGGGRDIDFRK